MPFESQKEMDAKVWELLHARPVQPDPPPDLKGGGGPAHYRELGQLLDLGVEFEDAWDSFIHAWWRYRGASFFHVPPPISLPQRYRAWLAGVAESLGRNFVGEIPDWVWRPEFCAEEEWAVGSEFMPFYDPEGEARDALRSRCEDAFLLRNVLYEARNDDRISGEEPRTPGEMSPMHAQLSCQPHGLKVESAKGALQVLVIDRIGEPVR